MADDGLLKRTIDKSHVGKSADVIVDRWEEFTGRKATLKRDAS